MKQLLIVLLLAGGGYYIYLNGFFSVFKDIKLSPKDFVADVKAAAAESVAAPGSKLPRRAPERVCGAATSRSSLSALEKVAFADKNSQAAAFALTEFAYNAGVDGADALITRYLTMFTKPEDKTRILNLVSKHKDRESLDLLNKFFMGGAFPHKVVAQKIAEFRDPEAAEIIHNAIDNKDAAVREAAQAVYETVKDEAWFNTTKKRALAAQHTKDLYNMPLPHTRRYPDSCTARFHLHTGAGTVKWSPCYSD